MNAPNNKSYLSGRIHRMDQESLKLLLQDTPVTGLRYFDAVGSTNDNAMQWIESGASDFSLVVADQQTAGRGRMQRKWVTNPGSALAFSLILHLSPDEVPHAGLIPFLAAVSVSSALEQLSNSSRRSNGQMTFCSMERRLRASWWNRFGKTPVMYRW